MLTTVIQLKLIKCIKAFEIGHNFYKTMQAQATVK